MRFSNASLVTAEPSAIYGAIITTDRLLYHPADILGRNPIAAQPLHISSGHRQRPGEEVLLRRTHLPDSACPWHPCQPCIYDQGGGCRPSALPAMSSTEGGGEDRLGLFCTAMLMGASCENQLLLGQEGWFFMSNMNTEPATSPLD